jgi:ribonuclease BN (tRNA processing enzyme)
MRVTVVGCGDAFGSGGRFNTCFLLEHAGQRALLDCGASSLIALKRLKIDPDSIGTIVLTHLHGDHFGGLVFLIREATLFKRRTLPLVIGGPKGTADRVKTAMETFFPGGWVDSPRFEFSVVEYEAEDPMMIGPLHVKPFLVRHAAGAPPYALRVSMAGQTVTYTGDTEWLDALIPAGAGADLLICEAYFFSKPINKHLSYETVAARIPDIGAKRVLLTHLNQDMLDRLPEVKYPVADDGMTIDLS